MPPLADEPEGPGFSPQGQMKSVHHRDWLYIVQRNMNVKDVLQCITCSAGRRAPAKIVSLLTAP